MNILYLCTDFGIPVCGRKGASIHVRELSQALVDRGHRVRIVTPRAGGAPPPGFSVPILERPPAAADERLVALLRQDPQLGGPAATEVRQLLYGHALPARILAEARAFAPELVYERYALLGTAGMALAAELDVPHILEVNAPLSLEQARHRGLELERVAGGVERAVFAAADHLIAVSRPLADWLQSRGVPPEKITTLPNGVDLRRFGRVAFRRPLPVAPAPGAADQPVVGFVGTLKPWHGTATLLEAMAELRRRGLGVQTLIVGDGPERAPLEALAERRGLPVTFTGGVEHARVPGFLAAMDVAVAPYDPPADRAAGFYFSPLKLFEYMAAGRPIVAAASGQIRELISHGRTGWLVPPGDAGALADGVQRLLEDPPLARAMGAAACAAVRRQHTWEQNAGQVEALAAALRPAVAATGSTAR
jgi:glycosyltransferase involved in cell wall biosynthesis